MTPRLALSLALPLGASAALAACLPDPETVGGIVQCEASYEVTSLGAGLLEFVSPQQCPGDAGISFDPNLYLLDCGKGKQITVFNAVQGTGPGTRDYRLSDLGLAARNAVRSGGLDAATRLLAARGEDGEQWGLGPMPAQTCAAAG